jgi:hypothetical protein
MFPGHPAPGTMLSRGGGSALTWRATSSGRRVLRGGAGLSVGAMPTVMGQATPGRPCASRRDYFGSGKLVRSWPCRLTSMQGA